MMADAGTVVALPMLTAPMRAVFHLAAEPHVSFLTFAVHVDASSVARAGVGAGAHGAIFAVETLLAKANAPLAESTSVAI